MYRFFRLSDQRHKALKRTQGRHRHRHKTAVSKQGLQNHMPASPRYWSADIGGRSLWYSSSWMVSCSRARNWPLPFATFQADHPSWSRQGVLRMRLWCSSPLSRLCRTSWWFFPFWRRQPRTCSLNKRNDRSGCGNRREKKLEGIFKGQKGKTETQIQQLAVC